MKDVECPYCKKWQEINHDDGYGYEEGRIYQQQCGDCDKYFAYTTSISYYYDSSKADCLNGAEHPFEATHTYPKECTRMKCPQCGERRHPTEQEMKVILGGDEPFGRVSANEPAF